MTARARDVSKGAAALVGLVAAIVGIPWALLALGESLPTSLPSPHDVAAWAGHPITDSALLRVLGLLCWAIWALFAIAIAIEVTARTGRGLGRSARRARSAAGLLHVPGLQGFAGACVLTAMLVLPQRVQPAGAYRAAPATTSAQVKAEPAVSVHPGRDGAVRVPAISAWRRYVVQRYDSPWSIAERQLGDGSRWRELRDSEGRLLSEVVPDAPRPGHARLPATSGGHSTAPRVLHPGDVVHLPPGSPMPDEPETVAEPARPAATTRPQEPAGVAGSPAAVVPRSPAGGRWGTPAGASRSEVAATPRAGAPAGAAMAMPDAAGTTPRQPDGAVMAVPDAAGTTSRQPDAASATPHVASRLPGSGDVALATVDEPPHADAATSGLSASAATPADLSPPLMSSVDSAPSRSHAAAPGSEPPVLLTVPANHVGRRPAVSVAFVEAGLLSAAVFAILEVLRRRQRQHRPFGRRIRLPETGLMGTELALRVGGRPDLADRVERAMNALVTSATGSATPMPSVLGAVVDAGALELLLDQPSSPPPPWTASAEGFRWRLADEGLGSAASQCSALLPALAPLGRAAGSTAEVLLNLEAAGILTVTGDDERAAGVVRGLAGSLSGLPWTKAVNLVLVGFGRELEAAPQVRTVSVLGEALTELRSTAAVMAGLLDRHHCRDCQTARLGGLAGDGWPPTIVLCVDRPTDADLARLAEVAVPGRGVAAVIVGAPGRTSGWTLSADLSPSPVDPLRLAVEPTMLPKGELDAVGLLFERASDQAGVALGEPPYDRVELGVEGLSTDPPLPVATSAEPAVADRDAEAEAGGVASRSAGPGPAVLIRVLGTVEVEGGSEFKRAKSRELAIYLAMHPHGVGEAELDEALWPSDGGRVVPASTRDSTVSVARTALGGPGRLLPAQGQGRDKRYQVSGQVGSDFAVFCALHRQGRLAQSAEPLVEALELVRGRPFEGVASGRTFTWVHTEGHARHIEAEVGDAADLAAKLLLERGQPFEARWAARQGLAADPLCERLWVRLMEAADDLGEGQEVERLMDELDGVLELGGDFSGLHPNTLAAYERFRRRPSRRGAGPH